MSWLQIRPPDRVVAWVPDLAEATGGTTYDRAGNPVPVSDRIARLEKAIPELERFDGHR